MKKLVLMFFAMFTTFSFSAVELEAKKPSAEPIVFDWNSDEVYELCWEEDSCEVDLWAGQHILAGSVLVSIVEGYISVDVLTDYEYDEIHIGVYNELPAARPAPGRMEFDPNHQYQVGDEFFLLVHVAFAETGGEVSGETAYAGDTQVGRAWYYYVPIRVIDCDTPPPEPPGEVGSETAWGFSPFLSTPFTEFGITRWGWTNQIPYDNAHVTLELWAAAGQNNLANGTHVGFVDIFPGPTGWTVIYHTFPGFTLTEVHVWVGQEPLPGDPYTAAPGQFNFIVENISTQVIPIEVGMHTAPFWVAAHAVVEGNYPE